jgi:hypothetical protein
MTRDEVLAFFQKDRAMAAMLGAAQEIGAVREEPPKH